jgi:hypothetical protein
MSERLKELAALSCNTKTQHMTTQDDNSTRKKQRSDYIQSKKTDTAMMDTEDQQPLHVPPQPQVATRGGPAGPSWSCRGCGRCNIHHTTALAGCWACFQVQMNGPTFDADRWGDFMICQQIKAEKGT